MNVKKTSDQNFNAFFKVRGNNQQLSRLHLFIKCAHLKDFKGKPLVFDYLPYKEINGSSDKIYLCGIGEKDAEFVKKLKENPLSAVVHEFIERLLKNKKTIDAQKIMNTSANVKDIKFDFSTFKFIGENKKPHNSHSHSHPHPHPKKQLASDGIIEGQLLNFAF